MQRAASSQGLLNCANKLLAACLIIWRQAIRQSMNPAGFLKLAGLAVLTGIGLILLPTAAFLLWAFGPIPYYVIALAAALLTGTAVLVYGVVLMRRGLRSLA